jgi:hypothetical protein
MGGNLHQHPGLVIVAQRGIGSQADGSSGGFFQGWQRVAEVENEKIHLFFWYIGRLAPTLALPPYFVNVTHETFNSLTTGSVLLSTQKYSGATRCCNFAILRTSGSEPVFPVEIYELKVLSG